MNYLLDPYPESFQGYLIRTDYRIAIQIVLCQEDPELTDYEKAAICLGLFYGNGQPDIRVAMEGIEWFMRCGKKDNGFKSSNKLEFSFEHDSSRIFSGFKRAYGIDLHKAKMHWFEFSALMADLPPECGFAQTLDYRNKDLSKVPKNQRTEWEKLKRMHSLPVELTEAEKNRIEEVFGCEV